MTIAVISPLNKFLPSAVKGFFANIGLVLLVNSEQYGGRNMIFSIIKIELKNHILSMKDDYNEENRENWK